MSSKLVGREPGSSNSSRHTAPAARPPAARSGCGESWCDHAANPSTIERIKAMEVKVIGLRPDQVVTASPSGIGAAHDLDDREQESPDRQPRRLLEL